MNLEPEVIVTFLVRLVNAVLWTVFAVQVVRDDAPLIRLARLVTLPVIVVGMWMLVIGSLATVGLIDGDTARRCYTLFCGFAALIAFTLVTSDTSEQ